MYKTDLKEIPLAKLNAAPWNYKLQATPEQKEKFKASVLEDESAGVLAVRHLGKGKYEVIDGNHRLEILQELGWDPIRCESFGNISKAKAIIIARRRNYVWFESNEVLFGQLLAEDVINEIPIDELELFMPETKDELEALVAIHSDEFAWQGSDEEPQDAPDNTNGLKDYPFSLTDEAYQSYRKKEREIFDLLGLFNVGKENERRGKVLEYLIGKSAE